MRREMRALGSWCGSLSRCAWSGGGAVRGPACLLLRTHMLRGQRAHGLLRRSALPPAVLRARLGERGLPCRRGCTAAAGKGLHAGRDRRRRASAPSGGAGRRPTSGRGTRPSGGAGPSGYGAGRSCGTARACARARTPPPPPRGSVWTCAARSPARRPPAALRSAGAGMRPSRGGCMCSALAACPDGRGDVWRPNAAGAGCRAAHSRHPARRPQ